MKVTILVFAALREALGLPELSLEMEMPATASQLRRSLEEHYPQIRELLAISRLAQGEEFLEEDQVLEPGSAVAVIPPVSGGSDAAYARVTLEELDPNRLVELVRSDACGAVDVFVGTVRTPNREKDVISLEYEVHKPMAMAQLEKILQEVRERWPGARPALHHRLGAMGPGEISVLAAVATPHRAESFEACRYLVERLKQDVPIWKKEIYPDGSSWSGPMGDCLKTE